MRRRSVVSKPIYASTFKLLAMAVPSHWLCHEKKVLGKIVLPFHFRQSSAGTLSLTFFPAAICTAISFRFAPIQIYFFSGSFFIFFSPLCLMNYQCAHYQHLRGRQGAWQWHCSLSLFYVTGVLALLTAGASTGRCRPLCTTATLRFFCGGLFDIDALTCWTCGREDNICWLSQTRKLNPSGI